MLCVLGLPSGACLFVKHGRYRSLLVFGVILVVLRVTIEHVLGLLRFLVLMVL